MIRKECACVAEFELKRKTALNRDHGFSAEWEDFACREIEGEHVWWGGIAQSGLDAFARSVKRNLGFAAPAQGRFAEAELEGERFRMLNVGDRQFFLMSMAPAYPRVLDKVANLTDQTDGWVGVVVEGSRSRDVLERLTGIDLYPSAFGDGSAARAPFEGMLGVIACESAKAGRFAIHFQRSSARSFVDHLCHAAASACGPAKSGGH
jgi:heterotetrameric sarcosine oxidase gamma subunit